MEKISVISTQLRNEAFLDLLAADLVEIILALLKEDMKQRGFTNAKDYLMWLLLEMQRRHQSIKPFKSNYRYKTKKNGARKRKI